MKLAEALLQRSALRCKLSDLKSRAISVSKIQDGDEPLEKIEDLLHEYSKINDEMQDLVKRIYRANQTTKLADGTFLWDALVQKDHLDSISSTWKAIIDHCTAPVPRYIKTELKQIVCAPVAQLRIKADSLSQERRNLDIEIQKVNWTIDV